MDFLISGITSITPQQIVMYVIGAVLIWLAINKDLEPVLLLPLGFGAILVNLSCFRCSESDTCRYR